MSERLQHRAVWYSEADVLTKGELTKLEDATTQVKFLKKYRVAWLEDENGQRVELDETDATVE